MLKKIFMSLILILFSSNLIFSQSLNFISYQNQQNVTTEKISYEITEFSNINQNDIFKLEIYSNEILLDESCQKPLEFDEETFYKKIICEIPKLSTGNYVFVGIIDRNNKAIEKTITKQSIGKKVSANLNYHIKEDETIISMKIKGTGKNLEIINTIPKEIIKELTPENQNNLIESELPYEILEADPVISWTIDEAPQTITYKIKEKTTKQDLDKIQLEIQEQQLQTPITITLYILIVILILFLFKPVIKKQLVKIKKNKKK